MKPAPFAYHRPESKAEALSLLANLDEARLLAGGQSLVPMLNMRYAIVDNLIDVNRLPDLDGIALEGDRLTVGAMTRQRDLLAHEGIATRAPIIAEALGHVGHLQTRNRGTVGGSLAHMDPAAELLGLAALLDATVRVEREGGAREIAIPDFPVTFMTPDLQPDEMITSVRFDLPAAGHGWGFHEFAQRHGNFAVVGAGALLELDAEGAVAAARLALIGVAHGPVRLEEAEALLEGEQPDESAFRAAAETLGSMEMIGDALASAAYRRRLAKVLLRRALADAADRAIAPV